MTAAECLAEFTAVLAEYSQAQENRGIAERELELAVAAVESARRSARLLAVRMRAL